MRKKMDERLKRGARVTIILTEDERRQVEQRAEEAGFPSLSEYVRALLAQDGVKTRESGTVSYVSPITNITNITKRITDTE